MYTLFHVVLAYVNYHNNGFHYNIYSYVFKMFLLYLYPHYLGSLFCFLKQDVCMYVCRMYVSQDNL